MIRRSAVGALAGAALFLALGCDPGNKPGAGPSGGGDSTVKVCGFDGVEAAIAAAKGKVVLIDCWATWCGPCVASFPKLVEKHRKYADQGLAVISLSLDKESALDDVIAFLKKNHADFTNLLLKRDAATAKSLDERLAYEGGIPHAVVFDRTGRRVWAGHPMDPQLTAVIEAELAK